MKFTLTEQQRPLLIGLSNQSYTDPPSVPTINAVGSSMPREVLRLLSSPSGDQTQPTRQFLLLHSIISLWTRTGLRNIIMTCSPSCREVWSQIILNTLLPVCGGSVCT